MGIGDAADAGIYPCFQPKLSLPLHLLIGRTRKRLFFLFLFGVGKFVDVHVNAWIREL